MTTRPLQRCLAVLLLALAALLAAPGVAGAEERRCTGSIGSVTLDNVRVPAGATCNLSGTFVKGTIKVEGNAILDARSVRVIGNVQAEGAASVNLSGWSHVANVQVKRGGGATVVDTRVDGDIQFDDNRRPLRADRNNVNGNIQVVKNRGGVAINGNTVNGNLQCKENSPAPTGGGNVVKGSAEDQCRRLVK